MHPRLIILAILSTAVHAHEGEPLQPHDAWEAWAWDPLIVGGLALSAWLYLTGARSERGIRRWEQVCYWTGWLTLTIALVSPLHPMGEVLFSAHMAQHEVMMVLAAPLLVLGRPLVPYLWGLPEDWRRCLGRWSKRPANAQLWDFISHPLHAWWIHFVALWGWHIPRLFQATITSDLVHTLQHLSFLISALLFWWALFRRQGAEKQYGAALLYIFTTMIHTGVLGVLLTFSTVVWYPAYTATTGPWGLTPLEDQQLGGLIMTVPPIAVYLAAFLVLFARWVRESDLRYRTAGDGL
jgi:putative membrane protein